MQETEGVVAQLGMGLYITDRELIDSFNATIPLPSVQKILDVGLVWLVWWYPESHWQYAL